MKFTVDERLNLMSVLPQTGNYVNLKLMRTAREALSFSEDEIKALKFVQDGAKISWDVTANMTKEVDLGEVVSKIIIKALKKLDAEENLTSDYFSLFEKFCV